MPLDITPASSLLDLELDSAQEQGGARSWRTGNPALDAALPPDLWCGGTVVGIGASGSGLDASANAASSLAHEIIATHLLDQQHQAETGTRASPGPDTATHAPGPEHHTSVYIIAPPDQGTSSIRLISRLLGERISKTQPQPQPQPQPHSSDKTRPSSSAAATATAAAATAKSLLTRISLLQYLDMAGLSEALAEIRPSPSAQHTNTNTKGKTVLLVQGLTATVNATLRRSGVVTSAALAAGVVGAIRDVVRGGTCIGLVEVEAGWTAARDASASSAVATAFAAGSGRVLSGTGLVSAALWRVVLAGMDVVVVVHDADGRVDGRGDGKRVGIVEVGRDERVDHAGEASALGAWAVWEGGEGLRRGV